jgi:hypothetical protein
MVRECQGTGMHGKDVFRPDSFTIFGVLITRGSRQLLCRKISHTKSLPHNSMSKTGSSPLLRGASTRLLFLIKVKVVTVEDFVGERVRIESMSQSVLQ